MSSSHVSAILRVMMETCRDEPVVLADDLASSVAELAVNELSNHDTDKEASELLVALSRSHCTQAMGGILCRHEIYSSKFSYSFVNQRILGGKN